MVEKEKAIKSYVRGMMLTFAFARRFIVRARFSKRETFQMSPAQMCDTIYGKFWVYCPGFRCLKANIESVRQELLPS
jgi:hypothetical protein